MNRRLLFAFVAVMAGLFFAGCSNTPRTRGGGVTSANFTFYVSGLEKINETDEIANFYAIVGVVTIDSNGNVTGGEEDYNDAFGLTFPAVKITGGTLTQGAGTQQGTLTLVTNNSALGVSGTETFALQVVNDDHGLIIQYDGSATSSGSFDLQTLPGTPTGNFAFTFSGVDSDYFGLVAGGVFTISGTNIPSGTVDINDDGAITTDSGFSGTIPAPDNFGRGTITLSPSAEVPLPPQVIYYIVNSKCIRFIDMDDGDSAVGSAYSQGTGTFTNASLGTSVFSAISGSYADTLYSVAGMLAPGPVLGARLAGRKPEGLGPTANYAGVADVNEGGTTFQAQPVTGIYATLASGYGLLQVNIQNASDFTAFGVYMTDPNLNLNDPNNTTSGLGGGLIAELDPFPPGEGFVLTGTGLLVPQTDTKTSSFSGSYAFGAQAFTADESGWEFDFVGQGSFSSGALTGTGFLNNPFALTLDVTPSLPSGANPATFTGTAAPDSDNPGRYTLAPDTELGIKVNTTGPFDFNTTIYQASGDFLVWMNTDNISFFGGSLQSLTSVTADSKPAAHLLRIIHH
jgi:hypothetical protein